MRMPVIQGVIDRRLLVNYRVDPAILQTILPVPFRPQLVHGFGIAGVCLIRFRSLRPRGLPAALGQSSENAAHRISVEWDEDGTARSGVYVLHRQTDSRLNAWAGSRLFPGRQEHARFTVQETDSRFHIEVRGRSGKSNLSVTVHETCDWPSSSVFPDVECASQFFARGAVGYSPGSSGQGIEGIEFHCDNWRVETVAIDELHSKFFESLGPFPGGSLEPDCGLLMRNIEHQWSSAPVMTCPTSR